MPSSIGNICDKIKQNSYFIAAFILSDETTALVNENNADLMKHPERADTPNLTGT